MPVDERIFDSPTEWLDAIRSYGASRAARQPQDVVFRGHSNAAYSLLPSSLRETSLLLDAVNLQPTRGIRADAISQFADELATIAEFFRYADATGLPLPEDSQPLRLQITEMRRNAVDYVERWCRGKVLWPPAELASLAGLAQHYGVSTRLLDWTFSADVAAYFAVEQAARQAVVPSVAVWILDRGAKEFADIVQAEAVKKRKGQVGVRFITAPSAWNDNLRAQHGLFTVCDHGECEPTQNPIIPLDVALDDGTDYPDPVLGKYVLDGASVRRALRLLAYNHVNGATVFPGFNGVARAIFEREWWSV